MPRNGSGTYTLPVSAFVAGSVIKSSAVNAVFSDIADEITNSLAADGSSSMTGQLKAASGSVSLPSYAFAADLDTGFYLSGTNKITWVAGGAAGADFNSDKSVTWYGTHSFAGGIAVTGTTSISGALNVSDNLVVDGSATFSGTVTFSNTVCFEATVSLSSTVTVGGNIYLPTGFIELTEIDTPTTPSSGNVRLFIRDRDSESRLAWIGDDGNVSEPGLVLVAAGSVSVAAALDITFTQYPFNSFFIRLEDFRCSADGADLMMRGSGDGGGTFNTGASDYAWSLAIAHPSVIESTGLITQGDSADTEIQLNDNQEIYTTASAGAWMNVDVIGANGIDTTGCFVIWEGVYIYNSTTSSPAGVNGGGEMNDVGGINAVRFLFSSGNIRSGRYYVYGRA